MVQFLTYIYLVFVLVFKTVFPFSLPAKNVTVPDTGSFAATDALGRQTVSAGESEKKVGIFYFLWLGEPEAVYAYCNLHGLWKAILDQTARSCIRPADSMPIPDHERT